PVMIPVGMNTGSLRALLSRIDGLLFTGGGDIDPQRFNGEPHPKVYGISPERDSLEFFLVEEALASGMPLLAICRGIQVLNIACGGSLYTHIQDQIEHSLKHDWFPKFPRDKLAHPVSLVCESKLQEIFGDADIRVNSLHHQGISRVGSGLKATAFAPDGLVEGLEVEGADFALGVQWHPEFLPQYRSQQRIFQRLVQNAREVVGRRNSEPGKEYYESVSKESNKAAM
ncbi:MAG: gamma-glutamyl-gamma-aminobutyrate hydrolase family protein, partial [Desulfohalobiaceae bacterium]